MMPVVPMFHANAWGLPYAALLAGSSMVFPGPNMTPKGVLGLLERHRVTVTAGVPTIWLGALPLLGGVRPLGAAADPVRRVGRAPVALGGLPDDAGRADPARLGHDRDVAGRHGREPAHAGRRARRRRAGRRPRPAGPADTRWWSCAWSSRPPARSCRGTTRRAGRSRRPGPWVRGGVLPRRERGCPIRFDAVHRRRLAAHRRRRDRRPLRLGADRGPHQGPR